MIDAHCHLQEFESPGEVIVGLEAVICCGSGVKSSRIAVELAQRYKEVYATVGVHPEEINDRDEKELRKLLKMPKVVAVGECGLDFSPETREEEKSDQRELFKFNIDLAKETGLPLVVHCRNAFVDIFQIFDRMGSHPSRSADRKGNDPLVMMHCFTGNTEQMQECVRRGWYISLGGIVTFKSSHDLRNVAKVVPKDKLLIETDAPYLAPEPVRGCRNEPKNVKIVAAKISEVRSTSINQIEEMTVRNTRRLFGI
mgnify:FL=1